MYEIERLKFLDMNPAAIPSISAILREEFLSMTLKDIRPSEEVAALIEAARRNTLAPRSGGRWRYWRKGGRVITVDVTATATIYGEGRANLAIIQNVSDLSSSPPHESERCVRDNGIGVAPKYADRIFECSNVFSRAHDGLESNPKKARAAPFT